MGVDVGVDGRLTRAVTGSVLRSIMTVGTTR